MVLDTQIAFMQKRRNRMVGHIMMNQGTYSVHQANKKKSQNEQIKRESQVKVAPIQDISHQ